MNHRLAAPCATLALLFPALAFAAVGKISALEGKASRTPKGAAAVALKVGSEIELGDVLQVEPKSNLKLTLNDASVLMLAEKSKLSIDDASFESQERKSFSAKLFVGSIWSHVTKALSGSDAKFEVTTERAVAGVRGTIFRVDAVQLVNKAARKPAHVTRVAVAEGKVGVEASVKKVAAVTPVKATPGQRKQIAGPTEISAEAWEKKFVELQANQQVEVGEELWKEASYDQGAEKDAFAKFVKQNAE